MQRPQVTLDGNDAAAYVAYKTSEVIAIYPITPSSAMGELADEWAAHGERNLWGSVPLVQEMQAEGGAAGAIHGALQTGALATTFTASQGLLLMIPNMYKIAGELTSTVFHVAARSLAAQGLSIFGDHSDVMAARATGWGMLVSNSVQEVMDFALIAQASTLESRIPFLHFFDGFRTSHEVMKIEKLLEQDVRAMIDDDLVRAHRARALSPDNPFIRGTAQNPDTYFQARETVNPFYNATPEIVQGAMDRFAALVGRQYRLFQYEGAPDAERVIVVMGSGAETVQETIAHLNAQGEKVGLLKVRLFRPFSAKHLVHALPASVKSIAVLDRTKEPGGAGEPLYQDVITAISEGMADGTTRFDRFPRVVGGRYGLSSKEFTPAMVKAVYDNLAQPQPKNHFTVGIDDDVTHTSLPFDPEFNLEGADTVRAMFWGLGADGTVGANKNSIKIIGEETPNFAQGYFVYDSKKSGARTVSHLRFGPRPIHSPYLIQRANFIAVHQFGFLDKFRMLDSAEDGAILLLNSPFPASEVWSHLPRSVQETLLAKNMRLYVINAYELAGELGMGNRINTIMQTCFFAISGVLPPDEAIGAIKQAIKKSYSKRGDAVVQKNYAAVDGAVAHLHEVQFRARSVEAQPEAGISQDAPPASPYAIPATPPPLSEWDLPPTVPGEAPDFVREVTAQMMSGMGDLIPVSMLPVDGTYPSGTTQWEKRNLSLDVPVWDPDICIQCGKCVLVCPHAVIRSKVMDGKTVAAVPEGFMTAPARWKELPDMHYTLQVSVEDCTGCQLCVEVCPVKDKRITGRKAINMAPQLPLREQGRRDWAHFLSLPEYPQNDGLGFNNVKNVQLLQPLFEFSGACSGCGETPYLKLVSQLFGDRSVIANATGCSSIYGGNQPTTPWAMNKQGRGPAWSNSLFEDNAEFGLGMRLTLDKQGAYAMELVLRLRELVGDELADAIIENPPHLQHDHASIEAQRERVVKLRKRLEGSDLPGARDLYSLADLLVRKTVWIVGGDGWAYDIGYGGLDHVLASGRNVNLLVLDTEVYSNTGGQSSKATPLGAVAKFAAGGKTTPKKDLGLMAMSYENVYVAQVAMGGNDVQTVRAILEAEAYDGPSLIIAYSHCIAHGIDMTKGLTQQKLAVDSGYWPLFRYDPRLHGTGKNLLQLDSSAPKIPFRMYAENEGRYRMLQQSDPEAAKRLMAEAQEKIHARWHKYEQMANGAVHIHAPTSTDKAW